MDVHCAYGVACYYNIVSGHLILNTHAGFGMLAFFLVFISAT
jgi:hypothetical protein